MSTWTRRWLGAVVFGGLVACTGQPSPPVAPATLEPDPVPDAQDGPMQKVWPYSDGTTEFKCDGGTKTCGIVHNLYPVEKGCLIVGNPGSGYAVYPKMHPRRAASLSELEDTTSVSVEYVPEGSGARFPIPPSVDKETAPFDAIRALCEVWDATMDVEYFEVEKQGSVSAPSGNPNGRWGQLFFRSPDPGGNNDSTQDLSYWYRAHGVPRDVWACPKAVVDIETQQRADVEGKGSKKYDAFQTACGGAANIRRDTLKDW